MKSPPEEYYFLATIKPKCRTVKSCVQYDPPPVIDVPGGFKGRHFLRIGDWSGPDLTGVLDLADELKRKQRAGEPQQLLPGRSLGMIFQKPSTRTRVSFEVGIAQLGGTALHLAASDLQLGRGETLRDTAVVLSRYLDAIMIRTYAQEDVEELAAHASIPVINGLTDSAHPCQALADLMTIRERHGRLSGIRLAYLGDGNNVCASLMLAGAKVGAHVVAATPRGYEPPEPVVRAAERAAAETGGSVAVVADADEASAGADVLYTDVWTSMGQDAEADTRRRDLAEYAIDERRVDRAADGAIVLHCLPAHYGEEVTEAVLHGSRSAAWDQAENRLHAQKALLALIVR
jgi:ornithine carbamoyltransferase